MTKLTFDVDFNKDPEEILKEIQERAKAEVAKRESKIKYASFLSKLHEKVNEEIGTEFKSINDLIRALTQFANPKLKEKISSSETGRRVTISMTGELFQEIKSKLALPNPNKAAIARETGASVVQVRKVASGGYDQKFAEEKSSNSSNSLSQAESHPQADLPAPSLPSATSEAKDPETTLDDVPEKVVSQPDEKIDLNSLDEPSPIEIQTPVENTEDEPHSAPPPAPSLDLPPVPQVPEVPSLPQPELSAPEAPTLDQLPPIAPPSLGEEIAEDEPPLAPPPAPSLDLPPVPQSPEVPSLPQPELSAPEAPTLDQLPPIDPPSLGEEIAEDEPPLAPPPAPSLDLPPVPQSPEVPSLPQPELSAPEAPTSDQLPPIAPTEPPASVSLPEPLAEELPMPPSFGEEMAEEPAPLAPPPAPEPADAPPSPPSSIPQPPTSSPEGVPAKPSLSLKPKSGPGGKPGKPTLSLKKGKKKPMGLKITRPPMRPPSA